jgi:hypothetical protein
MAVAYMEHVKLQFELCNLMLVRSQRACTLQGDLPSEAAEARKVWLAEAQKGLSDFKA